MWKRVYLPPPLFKGLTCVIIGWGWFYMRIAWKCTAKLIETLKRLSRWRLCLAVKCTNKKMFGVVMDVADINLVQPFHRQISLFLCLGNCVFVLHYCLLTEPKFRWTVFWEGIAAKILYKLLRRSLNNWRVHTFCFFWVRYPALTSLHQPQSHSTTCW